MTDEKPGPDDKTIETSASSSAPPEPPKTAPPPPPRANYEAPTVRTMGSLTIEEFWALSREHLGFRPVPEPHEEAPRPTQYIGKEAWCMLHARDPGVLGWARAQPDTPAGARVAQLVEYAFHEMPPGVIQEVAIRRDDES